jgi:hypothetical protein
MESYATLNDVASYLTINMEDLPAMTVRLISRASEDVYYQVRNQYDSSNSSHVEAVKMATCAQVEFWLTLGDDSPSIIDPKNGISIGTLKVDADFGKLCKRAKRYLFSEGLLYRGVEMR